MVYQKVFPIINDKIYNATCRMKETTKVFFVFACCFILEGFFFLAYTNLIPVMTAGSFLVLLMAIFSVSRKTEHIEIKRIPYLLLIFFALGEILLSLHHSVGPAYLIMAVDIIAVFPFLYFVLINNERTKTLYKLLSLAMVIESAISFAVCIAMSLQGKLGIYGNRVMGHFQNPNFLGAVGLITFISGLYLIMDKNNHLAIDAISSITLGIGAFYIIGSSCRAAILAAIGCILAFIIFIVKRRKYIIKKKKRGKVLITAAVFFLTLMIGMSLNDINAHFIEKNESSTIKFEQEQGLQEQTGDEVEEMQRRLNPNKDLDTFTSGRAGIWRIYISNFTLFGKEETAVADQFTEYQEWRAHNNIIEYYFKFGYIVGTMYLVFFVLVGIYGLRALFHPKYRREEDFFTVAIIGSYALYSLVEIATLPFNRIVPCFFFLSISTIVFSKDLRQHEAKKDSTNSIGEFHV